MGVEIQDLNDLGPQQIYRRKILFVAPTKSSLNEGENIHRVTRPTHKQSGKTKREEEGKGEKKAFGFRHTCSGEARKREAKMLGLELNRAD